MIPANELARVADALPSLVWAAGPHGTLTYLNRRWQEYAGRNLPEPSAAWQLLAHPEDLPGLLERWQEIVASGRSGEIVARLRRGDGRYRRFRLVCDPARDEKGTITSWYGLCNEHDDPVHAESSRQLALDRPAPAASDAPLDLQTLIETIPMAAWSSRPDGFCDFVNQRWLDYAGVTLQETAGRGWGAVIHPDDLPRLAARWEASLVSGESMHGEARMRRADGVHRWFFFYGNPLRDATGTIVKWFGTNVDIEDRMLAEEKLRRSEILLAEGQRVSQTGSFLWRLDTDEVIASDELHRMLGVSVGTQITLHRIADRVHPDDNALLDEKLARARTSHANLEHECRVGVPDGTYRNLRITACLRPAPATGCEYVGTIQDVTDRRRAEAALAEVRAQLSHMTRVASLGMLTVAIAHEVNQPLTGIITNCSTCQHLLAADPPDVEGALETVRRSIRDGHRASDVIKRLRALFVRPATETAVVDLNEAAREVIALSMNELHRNRVSVRTDFGASLPLVTGDRIQLQQVIFNLLMNGAAALASVDDRPRELEIRTEQAIDGGLLVSVQDNGVGIRDVDVERLFEAFYTTKNHGLGIGLSVSRSIVESHRGRLWARANDGAGATFAFSLPAASDGN